MGFEFGNVQELNSRITLLTFIAVVAFVVFFDFLVGLMEYFLCGSQLYNRMIQLIYKELMLMGLVSFTIIMAEALQKNSATNNPNYQKWIAGIEFSHILVFYLTFFFVAHAFYLMRTSVICSRKYRQSFCEKSNHMIDKVERLSEQEKVLYNFTYMPFQDLRNRVEFQLIHFLFNETYLLSEGFNFASYLSGCFDRFALKTINRSMFTWFILMILSVLNYGRILAGFGFHNCRGPPDEKAARRYLSSDVSTEPNAEEEELMSKVCPTMNVKLFVFMALLLVAYTIILVLVSRLYKLRLINRIGFKGPSDYLKFLKFAEDIKLSYQERMTPAQLKKEIEAVMDADEYESEEESEFKEIGEFLKMIMDTTYDVISNFILDSKIFVLGLIRPSRVSVKVDSAILSRKTDIAGKGVEGVEGHVNNKSSNSGVHSIRTSLINTSSHFHTSNNGHFFDHNRSSWATDDTEMMRSNKIILPSVAAASVTTRKSHHSRGTVVSDPTTSSGMASIVTHLKTLTANEKCNVAQLPPKYNPNARFSSLNRTSDSGPIMDMLAEEIDHDRFLQKLDNKPKDSPAPAAAGALQSLKSRSSSHEGNDVVVPYSEPCAGSPTVPAGRKNNLSPAGSSATPRRSRRSSIMAKQAGGAIEKFNVTMAAQQSSDEESGGGVEDSVASAASGTAAVQQPGVKRAFFTVVSAQAASAGRAKRNSMAVEPKELVPDPPQGFFGCTYRQLVQFFRGNKVAAVDDENNRVKKVEDDEKNSFIDIYLFGKPLLFFRAVELCIMFNCLYLAFWVTNFIVIDNNLDETYGWRVVGQFAMAVPVLFIVPSIGYIAETCSLLTAVSELNLEVVHAVLVETEDVTMLVNELRLKMLQRIGSVGTVDVKKMDIIHGLFSEIDKDGSGCIDHTEFRLLLKALKLTYSNQRFKRLYRAVDADGDNKIGYGEIDLLMNPPNLGELLQNDLSADEHFDENHSSLRELDKQESMRRASQSSKLMDRLKREKSAVFNKSSNVQAFKNADSKSPEGWDVSSAKPCADEMV